MPLGGIGTGSIALGGDGLLKQWQITNTIKHNAFVPNSFFMISGQMVGKEKFNRFTKALFCPHVHESPKFIPAKSVSDHKITAAMKEMFKTLEGVDEIQFDGEYPLAFLKYKDNKIPLEINLTAFNPFIPLDSKNSGLPIILFQFDLKNVSEELVEFTLIGNLMNFIGWDGLKTLQGNENPLFGGNTNILRQIGEWKVLQMKSKTILKADKRYGDVSLAIYDANALSVEAWDDLHDFWTNLTEKGKLVDTIKEEMSPLGKTWMGSLAQKSVLKPGESNKITFLIAWNFPNRVVDWSDSTLMNYGQLPDLKTEFWIGNNYNNWFGSSLDVVNYVNKNWAYLTSNTFAFHHIFFSTNLPREILTSISATTSTLRSPTCLWIHDGSFHSFEGCCGASTSKSFGGSCPMDCTHVWNYAFSLAYFFPSLERTMRYTEFKMQHEMGYLPHRSILPLYLPQLEMTNEMPPAIDGMFGMILKIYRDYLITGDYDFLKFSWPKIAGLMTYIFSFIDTKQDGVIYHSQPNTYDCELKGLNTFIGTLYLITLLVCERIAQKLDLPNWAIKCRKAHDAGRKLLDKECWNGEYYIQKYNEQKVSEYQYGSGCHSDQLMGQWWAFNLGFDYILPPEHVNKAIESIVKYNFRDSFEGIEQFRCFASPTDSGLLNCTWPKGNIPEVPIRYTNEIWTGIEYEVSALCFYSGRLEEGFKIIHAIRERYDGSHRNPWNEVECGDHYVRAMSSWTMLRALTKMEYNVVLKRFKIAAKMTKEPFIAFFITGTAWGQALQSFLNNTFTLILTISFGKIDINSIIIDELYGISPDKVCLKIKDLLKGKQEILDTTLSTRTAGVEIIPKMPINVKEGFELLIELTSKI